MRHRVWLVTLATVTIATGCGPDAPPTTAIGALGRPSLAAAAPAAPSPLAPAEGASVTAPVTLSWTATIDPTATNGGYNWEVSATPTFASVIAFDATSPGETQDVVSGLPNGTYYWRVNAASPVFFTPRRCCASTGRAPPAA